MKIVFELRHDKQDKAGTVPVYVSACEYVGLLEAHGVALS